MARDPISRCCSFALLLALAGLTASLSAQEPEPEIVAFTNLQDEVANRCFSVPLSTTTPSAVDIGLESGYNLDTWISKTFTASTRSFYSRSASDTFTVTVTAPPGRTLTRIHYDQVGNHLEEREIYWDANGAGTLTVNGVPLDFSFRLPTLTKSVNLTGQNLTTATVSIKVSLKAYRNSNYPRVKAAPGSASISVTDADIRVEYE